MSSIALKDNKIVYAKYLNINDKHTIFGCPTKNCKAKFKLWAIGSQNVQQYFRKIENTEHTDYCYLNSYSSNFSYSSYDKDTIDLDKLLNNILNNNSNKNTDNNNVKNYTNIPSNKILKANTLKNTYYMLKQLSPNNFVNKTLVRDIILDNRTDYYYKEGIYSGKKIAECKIVNFEYPIINIAPIFKDNIVLKLKFTSKEIFKSVLDNFKKDAKGKILSPLNKNFIVVIGNWKFSSCIIENIGQVFFIKKYKN